MATYLSSTSLFPIQYGVTDYLFKYRGFQLDDIVPHMAKSWEQTSETEMIINLREGIKWHNGDPFVADDVVFNFEKIIGSRAAVQELSAKLTPTAVNETTIAIVMDQPLPGIFDLFNYLFLNHPGTFDEMENGEVILGTGPFKFADWTPTQSLRLERNTDYWQEGKPYLDAIDYQVIPAANMATAMRAGDLDYTWRIPIPESKQIAESSKFVLPQSSHGFIHLYINSNIEVPPLDNKLVRQAINFAIDRDRIAEEVMGNLGPPMVLPFPDYSPGYFKDLADTIFYDLDRASALMVEAGYDASDAPAVPLIYSSRGGPPEGALTILQNDLNKIGLKSELVRQEAAVFSQNFAGRTIEGMWSGLLGYAGMYPTTYILGRVRPPNYFHYDPPGYSEFLEDIFTRGNSPSTVEAAMREFDEFLLDETLTMPVSAFMLPHLHRSSVKGFNLNVVDDIRLEELWLDEDA